MENIIRKLFPAVVLSLTVAGLGAWNQALAAQQAQYASGWSVNNNADWTPYPSHPNGSYPLGGPNDLCTGVSTPTGSWGEFTFDPFSIPATDVITGIELRVKILSQSGTNTMQLTSGGTLTGTPQTLPLVGGLSFCSSTAFVSAGSNGNLWGTGTTLTPADFNTGTIGVRLTQNANTFAVDAMELVVYHDSGVTPEADLAISKTDGLSVVNQGEQLTYTMIATNNGPENVTGASVSDTFPAGLTCTWSCNATAGSFCSSGPTSGNIADTVDLMVSGSATYTATCDVASSASGTLTNTASVSVPVGVDDPNTGNNSATDDTGVNEAPVAQCQDVEANAGASSCNASASVDDGSFDPNGDLVSLEQVPPGPYSLGDTSVTLTATDSGGLTDSCTATVTVIDVTPPVLSCNTPVTIIPPDAPISFTASATDSCGAVTTEIVAYDCYKFTKKGKRIDKTSSCVVTLAGDTTTILDSGGVGTTIEWKAMATDGSGNITMDTCSVKVKNPGKGKGKKPQP